MIQTSPQNSHECLTANRHASSSANLYVAYAAAASMLDKQEVLYAFHVQAIHGAAESAYGELQEHEEWLIRLLVCSLIDNAPKECTDLVIDELLETRTRVLECSPTRKAQALTV